MRRELHRISDLGVFDDGGLDVVFKRALCRVNEDLIDRPGVSAAREINITLRLTPEVGESGHLANVDIEAELKLKVPCVRTNTIKGRTAPDGRLVYNDLSPDDPMQRTLDEIEAT